MFALLLSVLIVAFIIFPGVVFRVAFSIFVPLKAFDRTRTQELAYSAVVCVVPFLVALYLVHHTRFGSWPLSFSDTWAQGEADYKTVLLSCFGEPFASSRDEFWGAALRSSMRLGRLLSWYAAFVAIEAVALGFVASRWGELQPKLASKPWADRLFTRLLLRNVSEWHVLLTSFLFPGTTMHADVLTVEDHLYQGDVFDYTRDSEGKLTGIYLNNAQRYDRTGLLADRAAGDKTKALADYWKPIHGSRLFVFADKISTLNIRPQTTLAAAELLAKELDPDAVVTVKAVEEPAPPEPPLSPPAGPTA